MTPADMILALADLIEAAKEFADYQSNETHYDREFCRLKANLIRAVDTVEGRRVETATH
jgi:hypothetical protein